MSHIVRAQHCIAQQVEVHWIEFDARSQFSIHDSFSAVYGVTHPIEHRKLPRIFTKKASHRIFHHYTTNAGEENPPFPCTHTGISPIDCSNSDIWLCATHSEPEPANAAPSRDNMSFISRFICQWLDRKQCCDHTAAFPVQDVESGYG